MSPELKIRLAIVDAEITAAGMVAENKDREGRGMSMAYGEVQFNQVLIGLRQAVDKYSKMDDLPSTMAELQRPDNPIALALFYAISELSHTSPYLGLTMESIYAKFREKHAVWRRALGID